MIEVLGPVQFNFYAWWPNELKQGVLTQDIENAFANLKREYEDIAKSVYEDTIENGFIAEAGAEYGLMMHTALVRHRQIHWLRETFEGINLADLSLAIAAKVYPKETFEVLEKDEMAIITNRDRTIVFDLKHFDTLSASASLALVNDPKLVMTKAIERELEVFQNAKLQRQESILASAKQMLERHSKETKVLQFSPESDERE